MVPSAIRGAASKLRWMILFTWQNHQTPSFVGEGAEEDDFTVPIYHEKFVSLFSNFPNIS